MKNLHFLIFLLLCGQTLNAQVKPGDVFRDYTWLPDMVSESEKFLRVGGKMDYQISEKHFPKGLHTDGHVAFDLEVDLQNAIKAEVLLEKVGSHDDTKGLKIQINKNEWIAIPDALGIPEPQSAYMHHYYPIFDVPLNYLNHGFNNTFKLEVDTVQRWGWPQNLIYGITIRVYYDMKIPGILMNHYSEEANDKQRAHLSIVSDEIKIAEVHFMGNYLDYNWEGDGIYTQWHYHYHKGKLMHNIGSVSETPYQIDWPLEWIPDQANFKIGAWVRDTSNLTYFIEGNEKVKLDRKGYQVHLYQPTDQPENWVTRSGKFEEKIYIAENIRNLNDFQLAWTSWSPCYANGVFVNDHLVFMRENSCYSYFAHQLIIENANYLQHGGNIISTGKTPLFQGNMVHGMEVQWPGIMVKVRYLE